MNRFMQAFPLPASKSPRPRDWGMVRALQYLAWSKVKSLLMTQLGHWLCTAAIVSVPIKVPVPADAMLSSELGNRYAATRVYDTGRRHRGGGVAGLRRTRSRRREAARSDCSNGDTQAARHRIVFKVDSRLIAPCAPAMAPRSEQRPALGGGEQDGASRDNHWSQPGNRRGDRISSSQTWVPGGRQSPRQRARGRGGGGGHRRGRWRSRGD